MWISTSVCNQHMDTHSFRDAIVQEETKITKVSHPGSIGKVPLN
jgi:hypothetical protein